MMRGRDRRLQRLVRQHRNQNQVSPATTPTHRLQATGPPNRRGRAHEAGRGEEPRGGDGGAESTIELGGMRDRHECAAQGEHDGQHREDESESTRLAIHTRRPPFPTGRAEYRIGWLLKGDAEVQHNGDHEQHDQSKSSRDLSDKHAAAGRDIS